MIKCIKLGGVHLFLALVIGCVFCMSEVLASNIPTPNQYERYLEELGDSESLKLKEQFSKLPQKKKQKLLRYFFDPELMKDILSQDIGPNEKRVLYSGDVVIENKTTVTEKDVEENSPSQTTGSFLSTFLFGNVFAAPTIKEYTANKGN